MKMQTMLSIHYVTYARHVSGLLYASSLLSAYMYSEPPRTYSSIEIGTKSCHVHLTVEEAQPTLNAVCDD